MKLMLRLFAPLALLRDVQHYSRHGLGASPILHDGLLIMP
jgi:hypothetical protein